MGSVVIPLSLQVLIAAVLTAAALFDSIRRDLTEYREQRASAAVVARVNAYVSAGGRRV